MAIPILIPAYRPGAALAALVGELFDGGAAAAIVVDDGSGAEYAELFAGIARDPRVRLLRHGVNRGKGAALKTGLEYAAKHFAEARGVVTADADGQHAAEDILRVAARLETGGGALVLGARSFAGGVPLRSRIGNHVTRLLMRLVVGQRLSDTQTGLRGIPSGLIPHLLRLGSTGYEFELDMLMACKHRGCGVVEEPIRTIYLEGNRSSHFHPILDSMRIYFLLFRFSVLSLLTAAVDNVVFAAALAATGSIGESQVAGRLVAVIFNYVTVRRVVFHSEQRHVTVLPKYVALVAVNGFVAYGLIQWMRGRFGMGTIPAKLAAESFLFLANFAIQRDWIFTRRGAARGGGLR